MFSGILILLSIIPGIINLEEDLNAEFGMRVKDCLEAIVQSDNPEHMMKISKDVYKDAENEGYKAACECYNIEGITCGPSEEMWEQMATIVSDLPESERMDNFNCFAMTMVNHYQEKKCEETENDDEFCNGFNTGLDQLKSLMEEKEKEGICCNKEKPDPKVCKKALPTNPIG